MTHEEAIADAMRDKLHNVAPPPLDVEALTRRGKRRVAARRAGVAVAAAVVTLGLVGGVVQLAGHVRQYGGVAVAGDPRVPAEGLRVYMDPGRPEIHIAGKTVPFKLERREIFGGNWSYTGWDLDTEAAATPYGVVYFGKGDRPLLIDADGVQTPLAPAPKKRDTKFHPSVQFDAVRPLVVWSERDGGKVFIRLYDLKAGEFVGRRVIDCESDQSCRKTRVEAIDQGLVFVRTADGNHVWNPEVRGEASWTYLGGSRIADVRDKVILMTGAPPARPAEGPIGDDWSFAKGEIEARLSFDGRWKLHRSARLEPVNDEDEPIVLKVPHAEHVFFDTDGSVLVAVLETARSTSADYAMYDCELQSRSCSALGDLNVKGGDPLFVGTDL